MATSSSPPSWNPTTPRPKRWHFDLSPSQSNRVPPFKLSSLVVQRKLPAKFQYKNHTTQTQLSSFKQFISHQFPVLQLSRTLISLDIYKAASPIKYIFCYNSPHKIVCLRRQLARSSLDRIAVDHRNWTIERASERASELSCFFGKMAKQFLAAVMVVALLCVSMSTLQVSAQVDVPAPAPYMRGSEPVSAPAYAPGFAPEGVPTGAPIESPAAYAPVDSLVDSPVSDSPASAPVPASGE